MSIGIVSLGHLAGQNFTQRCSDKPPEITARIERKERRKSCLIDWLALLSGREDAGKREESRYWIFASEVSQLSLVCP